MKREAAVPSEQSVSAKRKGESLARRLDRSVLVSLVRINIKYQIAAAELEAQRMQAMADAYRAVDEVLSG